MNLANITLPYQILIALVTLSRTWGWKREAAVTSLSTISSSKLTRYGAARHQAGKVEQPDLIEIIRQGLGRLKPHDPLWPFSGSTLRRLARLLERLSLPTKDQKGLKALSLASFRPGGATWLMNTTESAAG